MTNTSSTPERPIYLTSRFADERHSWGTSHDTAHGLMLGAIENGYHKGLTIVLTP